MMFISVKNRAVYVYLNLYNLIFLTNIINKIYINIDKLIICYAYQYLSDK